MTVSWMQFATVNPFEGMNGDDPGVVQNLAAGRWTSARQTRTDIVDPMSGDAFLSVPDTTDFEPFLVGLTSCPRYGLHNPVRHKARYVHLGKVCARAAALLADADMEDFFIRLIQRVMPKSSEQCRGEVVVTRVFLENFAGDGVRYLGRGFSNPGDRDGQESRGYRWPFGAVVVIAPFNFPLEIPALQALGALFMGNRPLVKVDSKVSVVFEQFLRLLIECGLDPNDIDLVNCRGKRMGELVSLASEQIRMVQFTGSGRVAESIAESMTGRVRLEDAGFDWKIIGPDFDTRWLQYVAWQCDQDAYAASGQKCSAQSMLFVHDNWTDALLPELASLAARRSLTDLTVGPLLSWSNREIERHLRSVMSVPGAAVAFGGQPLTGHSIPEKFGAFQPTAVQVPLSALLGGHFDLLTTELFGPFQVIVQYADDEIDTVLSLLEQLTSHLTAAVVSADVVFQQRVLGATLNGTTYCGMRARTTGAPQNHWFGPSGDPRAAGIGTPEAIVATWSAHREIIHDDGPLPADWRLPTCS